MLKKISNSLSTDNSIPIFGYSINEADIASASFFCVIIALYKAVFCPPPLPQISLHEQSCGLYPTSPVSVLYTFWDAVQKGMSRVKKAWFCPRESWDIHRDRRAVTYLVFVMCTTMMGKPDSGMDRGELRSTLSRAGSCRSSANNINEESQIRTRGLRRSGATMGVREWRGRSRNE